MKAARDYPILTVTAKGTRWLESGHPWVYDSDVAREPDGERVRKRCARRRGVGKGQISRHGLFEQTQ